MRKYVFHLFCGYLLLVVIGLSPTLSVDTFNLVSKTVSAQTIGTATTVSQASYAGGPLARGSLVTGFGNDFSDITETAPDPMNYPTILGGTTVTVIDAQGIARESQISFVSKTQVNHNIPEGTALGNALIIYWNTIRGQSFYSSIQVSTVSPGIFTADGSGSGVGSTVLYRLRPDGSDSYEPTYRREGDQVILVPIILYPPSDTFILAVYGTGFRNRSSLSNVTATVGGVPCTVSYAGPTGQNGLDQANVVLPQSLNGAGLADVVLTVDGQVSNAVQVLVGEIWWSCHDLPQCLLGK